MKRITVISFMVFLLAALWACAPPPEADPAENGVLIYYLTPEEGYESSDRIQGSYEQLGLGEDAPLRERAEAVVRRLLEGPAEGRLESPLKGVELLSLEIRDKRAQVDLSSAFGQLGGVDLAMADYCLTLSLTGLEGISAVSITAGGRAVVQQPKQVFYERDVLLSTMDDVLQTAEVTLYFRNAEGALAGEKRLLELYEGQTLAENLVAALLAGPENRELERIIPEDFQINSVRVESGVCYLNLSAASLGSLPEDEGTQQMILWSLADSLYSIEAVEELRLLADGEELNFFGVIPVELVAIRPQG